MSASITNPGEIAYRRSGERHGTWLSAVLLLAGSILAACGERDVPLAIDHPPAVTPLPIAMGVYYPAEFRTARCTVRTVHTSDSIEDALTRLYATAHVIGPSQVAAFDLVFPAMFQRVVPLEAPPPAPIPTGLTAIITTFVDQCLVVIDKRSAYYGDLGESFASITYRFTLTTSSGESIATWSVFGGRPPEINSITSGDVPDGAPDRAGPKFEGFTSGPWLRTAIRDAVAKFVAGFDTEPALAAWRAQVSAQKKTQ